MVLNNKSNKQLHLICHCNSDNSQEFQEFYCLKISINKIYYNILPTKYVKNHFSDILLHLVLILSMTITNSTL